MLTVTTASWLSKATGININVNKHVAQATGINIEKTVKSVITAPVKKTTEHQDGSTVKPLVIGNPQITVDSKEFESSSESDLVNQLGNIGLNNKDILAKCAMLSMQSTMYETQFYIPAIQAGDNIAKSKLIGIRTLKEKNSGSVKVQAVSLEATSKIEAKEIFHWRTVRKQWGNNKETRNDEHKNRGLTGIEIQQISDTLTNSIKTHPKWKTLPGADTPIIEMNE